MRIQRKNVLLKFKIRCNDAHNCDLQITAYDTNMILLSMQHNKINQVHTVEVSTCFPNKVILEISNNQGSSCELLGLQVAGVPINKRILRNRTEYKQNISFEDILTAPSKTTSIWENNGYALFDFFNPDPFVYLLSIGNKISVL
jgi:hypothetical protein